MDTNEIRAALNMLVTEMDHEADDLHEVHLKLNQLLDQLRATGAALPQDLVDLERRLARDVEGVSSKRDDN